MIETLLTKPYWVIDFLPEQVPDGSPGQFFAVERFYLSEPQQTDLRRCFADILLKLNCYYDFEICLADSDQPERNSAPERLFAWVIRNQEDLCVLLRDEKTLITLNRNDTGMTVYNPQEKLLRRLEKLAVAEGLFVWQPPQEGL